MDENNTVSTELSVSKSTSSEGINLAKLSSKIEQSNRNNHMTDHHHAVWPNNGDEYELKVEIVESSNPDAMANSIDDIDGILNNLENGERDGVDKYSDMVTSTNNVPGMIELSRSQEYVPEDIPDTFVTSSKKDTALSNSKAVVSEDDQQAVSSTTTFTPNAKGNSCLKEWFKGKKAKKVKDQACYICKKCKFICNSYSTMYSHIKLLHPCILLQSGNFLMKKQYDQVTGTSLLKRRFQGSFICQYCKFFTSSQTILVKHHRQMHDESEIYFSKTILKTASDAPLVPYPTEFDLKRRCLASLKSSNKGVKRCIFCSKHFQTDSKLSHHHRNYHYKEGPQKDLITGLYHCKLCVYQTVSVAGIRLHYRRNHFINALYAWNVTKLQDFFVEQDKLLKASSIPDALTDKLELENMSDILYHAATWSPEAATSDHFSVRPIPCVACEFSEKNVLALMEHYRLVHKDSYPRGFKQFILEYLKLYTKTVSVSKSNLCLPTGILGAKIDSNKTALQNYKFVCQLCKVQTLKFHEMASHFENIHPNVKYSISYIKTQKSNNFSYKSNCAIYKCELCEFLCEGTELNIIRHFRQHHPDVPYTEALLNTDLQKMEYSCRHCSFKGDCENMEKHYVKSHPSMDFFEDEVSVDASSSFPCKACTFTACSQVDLANHYEQKHLSEALTFCSLSHEGDSRYRCNLCLAILPTLTAITNHHTKHTNDSTEEMQGTVGCFCCKVCSRIFSISKHLWLHVTQLHLNLSKTIKISDLPRYVLEFGYFRDEDIQNVIEGSMNSKILKRGHSMPLGCESDIPNSNYPQLSTVKQNNETRSPNMTHIDHDAAELKAVTVRSVKKTPIVRCKFCTFRTSNGKNLCNHLQSAHKHDLSFRCFKCSEEFPTLLNCLKHHSRVHGLELEKNVAWDFLLNDISTLGHSDEKIKHVCSWCKYTGFSRALVMSHFNKSHVTSQDDKKSVHGTYFCKWCEYSSKKGTAIQTHIRRRHDRSLTLKSLSRYKVSKDNLSTKSSNKDVENVKKQCKAKGQKMLFKMVKECSIESDSDCSDKEDYESTHIRCKHPYRFPHVCKHCRTAYLCSTTFLKHCLKQHSDCYSASTAVQRICILPDPAAIPAMLKKLKTDYEVTNKKSVFYNGQYPCITCQDLTFGKLEDLQTHVQDEHDGKTIYMCCFCEFLSDTERTIAWHSHLHNPGAQSGCSEQSSMRESREINEEITEGRDSSSCGNESPTEWNDLEHSNAFGKVPDGNLESSENVTHLQNQSMKRARKSTRRTPKSLDILESLANLSSDGDKGIDTETPNKLKERDTGDANLHLKHSTIHAGLLRCNRCSFMCANPERMQVHIKSTHLSTKGFVCKFCDYYVQNFQSMDRHLANFHKIKKNYQLGLQIRYTVNSSEKNVSGSAGVNKKSRFLYTPTPCLPIMRAEVQYLSQDEGETDSGRCSSIDENINSRDQNIERNNSAFAAGCSGDDIVSNSSKNEDTYISSDVKFSCSYCGFVAESTYSLEVHMRRHERNFQDNGCVDKVKYNMEKFEMTRK